MPDQMMTNEDGSTSQSRKYGVHETNQFDGSNRKVDKTKPIDKRKIIEIEDSKVADDNFSSFRYSTSQFNQKDLNKNEEIIDLIDSKKKKSQSNKAKKKI